MKTKFKIVLLLLVSIVIGWLAFYFIAIKKENSAREKQIQNLYSSLVKEIKINIAELFEEGKYEDVQQKIKQIASSIEPLLKISIVDDKMQIRTSTDTGEIGSLISNIPNIDKYYTEIKNGKIQIAVNTIEDKKEVVRIFEPVDSINTKTDKNIAGVIIVDFAKIKSEIITLPKKISSAILLLIILPALSLFILIHFNYTKPLSIITKGINSVQKDNLGIIAPINNTYDEISILNNAISEMHTRLKHTLDDASQKMNELTRKNTELQMLHSFSLKISNVLEIAGLQEMVINFFLDDMKFDHAILLLWLQKDSAVISTRNKEKKEIQSSYLDLTNPTEEVISPRSLFKKENLLKKIGITEEQLSITKDEKHTVFLVLKQEKKVVGILALVKKNKENFSDEDVELLTLMARNLSVCIHRALLYESAITDSFTGFYLRKYFEFLLEREIDRARRYDYSISILCVEIDNFENMIQTYSQYIGDLAIKEVSASIRGVFRKTDIVSRFANNQFSIALPETGYNNSLIISKRFQKNIQQLWLNIPESNIQIKINISIGISIFPLDGGNPDMLLKKAQEALNNARSVSQTKIVFAKDILS